MVAFQALALGLSLLLAAAAIGRRAGGERSAATVVIFLLGSTIGPWLFWRMTESLQVALALAGLALTLGQALGTAPLRPRWADRLLDRPGAPWLGAVLLGLLAGLREPNAAVAAVPVLAALGARRLRRAALLVLLVTLGYGANLLVTWSLTGAPNPYKAPRSTFSAETGYPSSVDDPVLARISSGSHLRTSSLAALPRPAPRRTLYASFYFFVARHSGLFPYFPAALVLLLAAARGVDRIGAAALLGFAGCAVFFLVWWPANYFGGETTIGNRYLLAGYAALLFVPRRLPSYRTIAGGWLLVLALAGSALVSVARTRALDPGTQNHAYAGLFRLLPYESVASTVEGRRDRYWSGDFLRFVDPYARVDRERFELSTGSPAAEVEIATSWSGSPLHMFVRADAPRVDLVISDWMRRSRRRLGSDVGEEFAGVVTWTPSPAWRYHRFWWAATVPYRARLIRFRLETPDGGPATAVLRYLGRHTLPEHDYGRELLGADLPETATAGAESRIALAVANRCAWTWRAAGPLAVRLAARIEAVEGGESVEFRSPLPGDVRPGARFDGEIQLRWPSTPGRYRLVVDLLLEDVLWFGGRADGPLAEREIEITARP
jgi:hypothetical protein